jgi:hypothetical protein
LRGRSVENARTRATSNVRWRRIDVRAPLEVGRGGRRVRCATPSDACLHGGTLWREPLVPQEGWGRHRGSSLPHSARVELTNLAWRRLRRADAGRGRRPPDRSCAPVDASPRAPIH